MGRTKPKKGAALYVRWRPTNADAAGAHAKKKAFKKSRDTKRR